MKNQITISSTAKINWLLRVGPRRADGYHDICSVMQTLALSDEITITRRDDGECHLSGFPHDIDPDNNLVKLAWQAMLAAYPSHVSGVDISIKKILPRGGGLGGGSSNAGAVITAINALMDLPIKKGPDGRAHLRSIAATVGSDVPFFIPGGTAIVQHRGESVDEIPPAPQYHLVLIFPEEGMSTPEAYRQLDAIESRNIILPAPGDLDNFIDVLRSANPARLAEAIQNDFELVSAHYEWFLKAREKLEGAGALRAVLCGSGSTVAGLCADEISARQIAAVTGGTYTHAS